MAVIVDSVNERQCLFTSKNSVVCTLCIRGGRENGPMIEIEIQVGGWPRIFNIYVIILSRGLIDFTIIFNVSAL